MSACGLTVTIRTTTGDQTEPLADFEDRSRRENQIEAVRRAGAVPLAPGSELWVLPRAGAPGERKRGGKW